MSQRNPEEILNILEGQALEDDIRAIASMSDAELDDALRAEGADPGAVRAAGREVATRAMRAWEAQTAGGDAWVAVSPPPPRRSFSARWMVPLAATLTAAVVGGAMYAAGKIGRHDDPVIAIQPDASAVQAKAAAQRIRARALDACNRADWQACIDGLTAARTLDPAGDDAPGVQAAWQRAEAALDHERQRVPNPDSKTPGHSPAFPDTK